MTRSVSGGPRGPLRSPHRLSAAGVLLLLAAVPTALADSGVSSVGRDLIITRPQERVVAVLADVRVEARVAGDVIVWGGDVSFGGSGSVAGNVWVFGGKLIAPEGRPLPVGGSVSTPGTLLHLYLAEMGKAPWEESARSSVFRGLRVLGLAAWLLATLTLLYLFGSPFARAAARAEEDWTGSLLAGVLGVLTLFLVAAAVLSLLPPALSVPLSVAVAAVAVIAKVFGMGALFLLLGQKLVRSVAPARRPAALAAGFAVLGAISLLPFVGTLVWSAASVVAVGIALLSRFGAPRFRVPIPAR